LPSAIGGWGGFRGARRGSSGIAHCRSLGDRYEEAGHVPRRCPQRRAMGRAAEAAGYFDNGFQLFEEIQTPYEWGKLWMAYGDWMVGSTAGAFASRRRAREAYEAARDLFERHGCPGETGRGENSTRGVEAESPRSADSELPLVHDSAESGHASGDTRRVVPRPTRRRGSSADIELRSSWAIERFGVVTASSGMFKILETVEKLACSRSPVLVLGESGTGKELIAQALHEHSGRKGQILAINCAAIPREVIESELFGHVAGAFTARPGQGRSARGLRWRNCFPRRDRRHVD